MWPSAQQAAGADRRSVRRRGDDVPAARVLVVPFLVLRHVLLLDEDLPAHRTQGIPVG